jgi:hypothetical protein
MVNSWELGALDLKPRLPEILSPSDSARAIVLDLAAIREKLYARRRAAKRGERLTEPRE